MVKEKVTLFFCDIVGTFDSGKLFLINNLEIKKFVDNLNNIIQYNKTDKIIFSFVTTENLETLHIIEEQFKPFLNDNICVNNHIYYDDIHNVDKPYDIIMRIKSLELLYDIEDIYYADDTKFYHDILNDLKDCYNIKYKITSIIPGDNGLHDVNIFIENLVNNYARQKIKK